MSESDGNQCVVLASGSSRRRELLGQLLDSFEITVSGVPEPIDESSSPAENVLSIARSKAAAVVPLSGGCVVLAADTDVVLDGEILGKPVDFADAVEMLTRLRGRAHLVLTAVVVIDPDSGQRWGGVVQSRVRIRDLAGAEIERYVATGEPLDKAGGYAIQGEAASMVEAVEGCYTNVVGLPLCLAWELLARAGVQVTSAPLCEHGALPIGCV